MADYNFVNVDIVMKLEPIEDLDHETNMYERDNLCLETEPVDSFVVHGGHDVKEEIKRESPQTDDGDHNSYLSQTVSDDEDVMNIRRRANIATATGRGRERKRGRGRRRVRERPGFARTENDSGTDDYEEIEAGSSNCGRTRDSLTRGGGVRSRGGSERARGESERVRGGSERSRSGSEQARGGSERVRGGSERARGGSERARGANALARGAYAGSRSKPQGVRGSGNTDSESFIEEGLGILQDDPLETPKPRRILAPRGTATTNPMLPGPSFTLPRPRTVANPFKDPSTPSTSNAHTMFQGTDGATTPRKVSNQQPLENTDEDFHQAYGSENDSEEDDDANLENSIIPMFVPRTQRDSFPFDDEDESPAQEIATEPPPSDTSSVLPFLEPRNLFSFEWRDFSNPPVPPTERREVFSDTNCGPTAPFLTPYDAFTAIWNREIMEYIVLETNRYAQQIANTQCQEGSLGRINQWQETNVDELYIYFALLLGTSMCYKSDIKEYWYKEGLLATPYFGHYMTYNRFLLLSRCLHFNNNTTDLQTMTRSQAKIFKIAPVVQHLNHQFQSLYNLNRNIALDESLTQWLGLLNIKQFMKNKAASCGIKTFEVCEAQTGYLWRFKVHAGREEAAASEVTPVSGVIPTLVLELLEGLENKGHTVWMDKYYNSPALARVLKSLGFDCVGTLRTNRQFVPPQLANLQKSDMAVGQISGCTSGDVDIMVWRDKNRVGLISTYHGAGVHTDNQGNVKPIVVRDYNLCMGGVDKKDQMLSMYRLERKRTQVWYKKFFRRLLNASILNSYILHSHSSLPDSETRISNHRKFRQKLLKDLLRRHSQITIPTHSVASSRSTSLLTPQVLLEHLPKEYGLVPGTTRNERLRRVCIVCRKRIQYHCPTCMVPLCPTACHRSYHKTNFNQIWF